MGWWWAAFLRRRPPAAVVVGGRRTTKLLTLSLFFSSSSHQKNNKKNLIFLFFFFSLIHSTMVSLLLRTVYNLYFGHCLYKIFHTSFFFFICDTCPFVLSLFLLLQDREINNQEKEELSREQTISRLVLLIQSLARDLRCTKWNCCLIAFLVGGMWSAWSSSPRCTFCRRAGRCTPCTPPRTMRCIKTPTS